ncbi:hypothetical protein U27_01604 [Candidatus Vecturithrix granuli]|uniref:Uncharacterized protein n=1 Tax=Vecturithrix granuli TaxID=1499967 RepID=A0A0S6WA46_VECG1|nr:hypothetical protein U27_01604 [Candidatus Vecturithrix granuli]
MQAITYIQVQELVTHIPITKLQVAYEFLRDLAGEKPQTVLPQIEFMFLPFKEQQHLLSEQAAELVKHYKDTQEERELWQGGDLGDY